MKQNELLTYKGKTHSREICSSNHLHHILPNIREFIRQASVITVAKGKLRKIFSRNIQSLHSEKKQKPKRSY